MLARNMLKKSFNISRKYLCLSQSRRRLPANDSDNNEKSHDISKDDSTSSQQLGVMSSKYQVFEDKDSQIILDVYEERLKHASLHEETEEETHRNPFDGINLERGRCGVYDIEDLVEVLQRENCVDVFVAAVPKELKYVDYICIVSGKSQKHMQAIAQFVRRVYKQKMHKNDLIPKLEGANSNQWMALDLGIDSPNFIKAHAPSGLNLSNLGIFVIFIVLMLAGNIALHIFSRDARQIYDLDSLWSVGPQFDKEYNKQDPVAEMLEKHSLYLHDLEPAR